MPKRDVTGEAVQHAADIVQAVKIAISDKITLGPKLVHLKPSELKDALQRAETNRALKTMQSLDPEVLMRTMLGGTQNSTE